MKTKFKDILDSDVRTPFAVNSKIYDIAKMAEILENLAKDKIDKEGDFAQVSCVNLIDWMKEIQDKAENVLDMQLANDQSCKMKHLLSKSDDGHIIIAQVPHSFKKRSQYEFFVSEDCLRVNLESNNFTDITDQVDWDGKVWMLTSDMQ